LTVVAMLGVPCASPSGVFWPANWSIGTTVLTPANDWMPPTAPVLPFVRSQK
jgi:hypothetical protein